MNTLVYVILAVICSEVNGLGTDSTVCVQQYYVMLNILKLSLVGLIFKRD